MKKIDGAELLGVLIRKLTQNWEGLCSTYITDNVIPAFTILPMHQYILTVVDNPSEVYDKFTSILVSASVSHMVDSERYFENIFIGYLDPWHECIVIKTNNNVLVKHKPFYENIPHIRIHNIKHKTFDIIVNEDEFLF